MITLFDQDGKSLARTCYLLLAKHTEEERQFVVYPYRKGDFLLRDVRLPQDHRMVTVIPPRYKHPEIYANTVWEHFKSTPENPMTYLVHGRGIDLSDATRYVLYSPQYQRGRELMLEQQVDCLARPEEMFFSGVSRDGYNGPRFRKKWLPFL